MPVNFNYLHQYQIKTEPVVSIEPVTESRWHQAWSEPVRQKINGKLAVALIASGLFAPVLNPDTQITQNFPKWYAPLSEPVRIKSGLAVYEQQSFAYTPGIVSEVVNLDKWYAPLSEPIVKSKSGLGAGSQQFLALQPTPIIAIPWFASLTEPVRLKLGLGAWQQQFLAAQPNLNQDVTFSYFAPLSDPSVKFKRAIAWQQFTTETDFIQPVLFDVQVSSWYPQFSEPVRIPPALKAALQAAFFAPASSITPYNPTTDAASWLFQFSEPVRIKLGLRASSQQSLTWPPQIIIPTMASWWQPLHDPVRFRPPRLITALRQFIAQDTVFTPPATSLFAGWYRNLNEPVRLKRGLLSGLQQFFATDPQTIVPEHLIRWFASLSEPVRIRLGLRVSLQQFFAGPPRLLPTPNITGAMAALETKDTFLAGAVTFNPPASAEIGVVNEAAFGTEVGVIASNAPGTITTVGVSIRII